MYKRKVKSLKPPLGTSTQLTSNSSFSSNLTGNSSINSKRQNSEEPSSPRKRFHFSSISPIRPTTIHKDKSDKILTQNDKDKSFLNVSRKNTSKSFFESVMKDAGYVLSQSKEEAHCLNMKQMLFVHKLEEILQDESSNWTSGGNLKRFMKDLKDYLNEEENFLKALQATQWPNETISSQDGLEKAPQSSLLHLLLLVKCIQPKLLSYVFQKANVYKDQRTSGVNDTHILQLIFRQLRFIGTIVDEESCIDSYFKILESSEHNVQVEMVCLFQDIFSAEYHDECAKRFQALLTEDSRLTPAILEVLSQLTLSPDLQMEYIERMLQMLPKVSAQYLPTLIEFLLTNVPVTYLSEVVNGLRKCQILNPKHEKIRKPDLISEELKTVHTLAIESLRSGLMMSRPVTQHWLKTIKQIHNSDKHDVMDLVFLLLLHSTTVENKKIALTVMKNKFQSGIFTTELLEKLFNKPVLIVEKYLTDVLVISSNFLNARDSNLLTHGITWFRLCLLHLKDTYLEKVLLQLVHEAMHNSSTSSRAALELLIESISKDTSKFAQHGFCILKLLPTVFSCEIMECCQIMDLVSRLAYSRHGHQMNIDDNIAQHIRKMLLSCDKTLNAKGIVSGILAAKNIALDDFQYDSPRDTSELLIQTSDDGSQQELTPRGFHAKKLLEKVINVIGSSSSSEGLFFEHLATVISSEEKIDNTLLLWLYYLVEADFKEQYANSVEEELQEDMTRQYAVDETNGICIELAVKVKEESKAGYTNSRFSMIVLYPMFRLFRILTKKIYGDLNGIDGVLSCSVILPSPNMYEDFYMLDTHVQKYCVDCLFHTVNWFIELINAFVREEDNFLGSNVCHRMEDIISLLEKMSKYIVMLPDYKPPVCTFYTLPIFKPLQPAKTKKPAAKRKAKKQKKKKKPDNDPNTSIDLTGNSESDTNIINDNELEDQEISKNDAPDFTWLDLMNSSCKYFFRELDTEVFRLFHRELNFQHKSNAGVLSCNSLLFLLMDFVAKVEYKLPARVKKVSFLKTAVNKDMLFSNLLHCTPLQFAQVVIKYVSPLCEKLEVIFVKSKKLIDLNGTILDSVEMFTDDSSNLKLCCAYILQALGSLFSWESLHMENMRDFLQDALKQIASRSNHQYEKLSFTSLVNECCNYVLCYKDMVLDIHSARYLVRLAEVIIGFNTTDQKLKHKLAETCHSYLTHSWFSAHDTEERGATYNKVIESFIKTYLNNVSNPFDVVIDLIDNVASEMTDLTSKEGKLKTLRSVNKANFNLLISNVLGCLVTSTSEKLKSGLNDDELMSLWNSISISLKKMIEEVIHKYHTQPCVLAFTKNCLPLLKLYVNECLPFWEKLFANQPTEFVTEVGNMQTFFRYVNVICNHAKRSENASLLKYVPDLREASEKLIYTMKSSLAFNQCTEAFYLGYLKDRDLEGVEITSQPCGDDDDDEEEEDKDEEDDSNNDGTSHKKKKQRTESEDELSGDDLDSVVDNVNDDDDDDAGEEEIENEINGAKKNKSASIEF